MLYRIRKSILQDLSTLYAYLANDNIIPDRINKIDISVMEPDCGWLTLNIKSTDNQEINIDMSDVYNPLNDVRKFMETAIIDNEASLVIDCELYKVYIWLHIIAMDISNNYDPIGLLAIYDDIESEKSGGQQLITPVKINQFISNLYISLKQMALNSTSIVDNWDIYPGSNNDWSLDECRNRLFNDFIYSKCIEDYLIDSHDIIGINKNP